MLFNSFDFRLPFSLELNTHLFYLFMTCCFFTKQLSVAEVFGLAHNMLTCGHAFSKCGAGKYITVAQILPVCSRDSKLLFALSAI